MDWYNEYARHKAGVPEGWAWFEIRWADNRHMIAKGAVCNTLYKRGPRKGQKNWRWRDKGTEREIVIPMADLDALKVEWSRETGNCAECAGRGQMFARWTKGNGMQYAQCAACKGTGRQGGEQ